MRHIHFLAVVVAVLLVAVVSMPVRATDTAVTIPTAGIDMSGTVTNVITSLGAIVATCIGAYFAFVVIRKALRWARRAG